MSALLEARGLGIRVEERSLLQEVSFSVEAGERIALIGQNGAGKSTLLDLLSGVGRPSAGQALFEGRSVHDMERREAARRIATVPQLEHLPDDLGVLDAVLMGRAPFQSGYGLPSDDEIEMCRRTLGEVDLKGFEQRGMGTLSGGERQRVLIARAMVQEPKLLLLDEPTSSLDLGHALYIAHLSKKLAQQGVTVITAVHDLNQVPLFAERVLILHRGRLAVDEALEQALDPEILRDLLEVDLVKGEVGGRLVLVPS